MKLPVFQRAIPLPAIVMALGLGMLLAGCVPYSWTSGSQPIPDVVPRLPEALRESNAEVMVMAQSGQSGKSSVTAWSGGGQSTPAGLKPDVLNVPAFMSAGELSSHIQSQKLATERSSGVVIFSTGSAVAVGKTTLEVLRRVCVITHAGQNITIFADNDEQSVPVETIIFENRRNAMVAALRADTTTPFEKVDGPCGISGEVSWPRETRTRAIEFLARIPGKQPVNEYKPLAQVLGRAKPVSDAAALDANGGMLVIATSLHGQSSVEAPKYFSADDFKAVKEALLASNPAQILALLPTYASGRHAIESLSLDVLCAVGSDGRLLWWSKEQKSWRGLQENPFDEEWRPQMMAALGRLTENDRRPAIAFLDRTHIEPRERTLDATIADLRVATTENEISAAKLLLLGVMVSRQQVLVAPVFLQTGDIASVVTGINALTAGDLMNGLTRASPSIVHTLDGMELNYLCLISEQGRLVELRPNGANAWDKPRESRTTAAWRQEAISAILRDGGYQGNFVCSLERAGVWSEQVRGNVTSFLQRLLP